MSLPSPIDDCLLEKVDSYNISPSFLNANNSVSNRTRCSCEYKSKANVHVLISYKLFCKYRSKETKQNDLLILFQ